MGVTKIFVYVLHVHPNIIQVLDYYWLQGITYKSSFEKDAGSMNVTCLGVVEVIPVTNPGDMLSWSPLLFKRARDQSVKIRWHTDEYDYYDCLMRNHWDFEVCTNHARNLVLESL